MAKYSAQKLIKQKKTEFLNTKLTENIGKLKEYWKSLKTPLKALQQTFTLKQRMKLPFLMTKKC